MAVSTGLASDQARKTHEGQRHQPCRDESDGGAAEGHGDIGDGDTFAAFKANSYPDYYIIDRKGNLRWGDLMNSDVEAAIKLLIAEKE